MSTTARTTMTRALGVALLAGLALAGCSSPAGPAAPAPSPAPAAGADAHNQADLRFAGGMVVHHRQALEMTRLVPDRSTNPQVADLSRRIEAAQGPEISTMTGMLERWGADEAVHTDHDPMDHSRMDVESMDDMDHGGIDQGSMGGGSMDGMDHGGMDGMMTAEEMAQLDRSAGPDFDRLFLQLMIAHHEGAVRMAQAQIDQGSAPEALALARAIVDAQQGEIDEMRALLSQV
ncbi:DUF305 domain-containing protein [Pseudonocardia sp. H11422]|uniref:DUF305 domain-containing protein n=1 Tax=Pseudonocardia sp. H11422 TaxID=2835866 RepID=UPI001BDC586B|nr:DUF305 domain-containing protein [Pseudonocardia sp. H11422]